MMPITNVVKQLLILNIIFYIGSNFVGVNELAYNLLSLYYPESSNFKVWQPVTHMFMHAQFPGITHIVFNMLGLVMFGSPLEHYWGSKKFLFFYISCGLGAALVQIIAYHFEVNAYIAGNPNFDVESVNMFYENTKMVGASGAIYGLLIAFAFMFPNAELMLLFIPFPVKAKYFVPILVGLDLFSGVTGFSIFGGGVAHFAHVGGALFGLIMMLIWRNNKFKHNRWN